MLLNSCYKPVYTEYFQEENYTKFTTHEILIEIPSDRILKIFASRRCPGRTICEAEEIKLRLSLNTKFSFLEGKDFSILSNDEAIDLNQRRYFFDYNSGATYSDGTSGFAIEQWVVWVDSKNFKKIIQNKDNKLKIGDYTFTLPSLELEKWKILISKPLLLETPSKLCSASYIRSPSLSLIAERVDLFLVSKVKISNNLSKKVKVNLVNLNCVSESSLIT